MWHQDLTCARLASLNVQFTAVRKVIALRAVIEAAEREKAGLRLEAREIGAYPIRGNTVN